MVTVSIKIIAITGVTGWPFVSGFAVEMTVEAEIDGSSNSFLDIIFNSI